jgi:hypothetical protein
MLRLISLLAVTLPLAACAEGGYRKSLYWLQRDTTVQWEGPDTRIIKHAPTTPGTRAAIAGGCRGQTVRERDVNGVWVVAQREICGSIPPYVPYWPYGAY